MEMYRRKSRLKARQHSELIKLFVAGSTARATAEIVGVHRNTSPSFFMRLDISSPQNPRVIGSPEKSRLTKAISEACAKGRRGRGAAGKVAVFGMLKKGREGMEKLFPNQGNSLQSIHS